MRYFKLMNDGNIFMIEKRETDELIKNRIKALGNPIIGEYSYKEISENEFNKLSNEFYENNKKIIIPVKIAEKSKLGIITLK